jgi:hypothetical protein
MITLLRRGQHYLPHQSQMIRRDLNAEQIKRHPGARAMGWRRSPEQIADERNKGFRAVYEYLVHSPESVAMSWTAFYTLEGLQTFAEAYNLTLDPAIPVAGDRFQVLLPMSDTAFKPLVDTGEAYNPSKNYGPDFAGWTLDR